MAAFDSLDRYRARYGYRDFYDALVLLHRSVARLIANRMRPRIDGKFVERLMLAVTEVNGCAVCSWAHTGIALKKGFAQAEIDAFLSGSGAYVVPGEATAILFAQHYAGTQGRPERQAWEALVQEYGAERARLILAAIQVMMVGNISGLPLSALLARLKGRPYARSSVLFELGMQLAGVIFLPVTALHALLCRATARANIRFAEEPA
ncbi:MAG TPA: carboxymuconolactone decarboxylase family protein [Anaeromyxobacteraceae bacterium]|nr:carboxymuconolactone decarboxylase family protein [Anaeromyxobacteraceae bacterium]